MVGRRAMDPESIHRLTRGGLIHKHAANWKTVLVYTYIRRIFGRLLWMTAWRQRCIMGLSQPDRQTGTMLADWHKDRQTRKRLAGTDGNIDGRIVFFKDACADSSRGLKIIDRLNRGPKCRQRYRQKRIDGWLKERMNRLMVTLKHDQTWPAEILTDLLTVGGGEKRLVELPTEMPTGLPTEIPTARPKQYWLDQRQKNPDRYTDWITDNRTEKNLFGYRWKHRWKYRR